MFVCKILVVSELTEADTSKCFKAALFVLHYIRLSELSSCVSMRFIGVCCCFSHVFSEGATKGCLLAACDCVKLPVTCECEEWDNRKLLYVIALQRPLRCELPTQQAWPKYLCSAKHFGNH